MGFMNAPSGSGDFNIYLKYDARAGRWYTKQDGGELEEVANMTAVFDLENIRTGWFQFFEGQAPDKVFDDGLDQAAPKPNAEAKRGFEVLCFSEKNIFGLREFSSTAATVIEAMNDLYDDWQANAGANKGKLPVVKCVGVNPVKTAKSTNYKPQFEIVSWAPRPAELAGAAERARAAPPKQAAKAPEPAMADDDAPEF